MKAFIKAISYNLPEKILDNEQIAKEKTDNHLHISELVVANLARHRNKRDTRNACANHSKGHKIPWRAVVADEERVVVGFAPREPRDAEQHAKIGQKHDYDKQR